MDLATLIAKLCDRMEASIRKHETEPDTIRGCLDGVKIVRTLKTPEDFVRVIKERSDREMSELRDGPIEEYWLHRHATVQVEWAYEVVQVGLGASLISARAGIEYATIVAN